ncbi:hypothetical protein AB2N08_03600 [Massilia aurea]|uniref:hypothetical protein n=1 Tax=Massilia aurea TaxID=373040 RepID=UPI0034632C67
MDHDTARQLMAIYTRAGAVLSEADPLLRTLPEDERLPYLRTLGAMYGDIWFNLQLPIVREHRDLDPDGDRFQQQPAAEPKN